MNEPIAKERMRRLAKLLDRYRTALVEAGVPNDVTDDLQKVGRFLASLPVDEATSVLRQGKSSRPRQIPIISPTVKDLPLNEIFEMLRNEKANRRDLEAVAVGRFGVPKGSLSSFSNMQLLKDKITTLAKNEQAHNTISEVARHTKV